MNSMPAYGLWQLVVVNSFIILIFVLSFFRPRTRRDWRTFGTFSAFVIALFTEGYWFIGLLVFLCSVVLPPAKLASLWVLSQLDPSHPGEHRARLFRFIEAIGKWSMLDVMLVAVLVAFVKLGDLVQIEAGPGMVAFAMMVVFSLVAGLLFNPHAMWNPREAAS